MEEKFIKAAGDDVKDHLDAEDLLSILGKFHHMTLVWTAGRPSLYALWQMFFTATFKEGVPYELMPRKQILKVTAEAKRTLQIWWHALTTQQAPQRRMLRMASLSTRR